MRVLVACEFSGTVRRAFRNLGHDAWSCDLLPAEDDSEYHFHGDIFDVLEDESIPIWDLMIAHPPCTYLTVSGLHWNKKDPKREEKTQEAIQFVQYLLEAPVRRMALENQVSCISTRVRKPDQIIQPYEFGHDASKKTCLWLRNLPPLKPTSHFSPRWVCCGKTLPDGVGKYGCPNCNGGNRPMPRWGNQTDSGQNRLGPSEDRWKERSRTYEGIAEAMAEQWGALDGCSPQ